MYHKSVIQDQIPEKGIKKRPFYCVNKKIIVFLPLVIPIWMFHIY